MKSPIKRLNFRNYATATFALDVKNSLETTGFFLLENHTIPEAVLMETRRLFKIFFTELTLDQKMQYAHPELLNQLGYVPVDEEVGEFAKIADRKELWHYGDNNLMMDVPEVPGLREIAEESYYYYSLLYRELMRVVASTLSLDRDRFDDELGDSLCSINYYPSHEDPVTLDEAVETAGVIDGVGMCASKHTDINDLTLLHATEPGLELWHDERWIPVQCNADTIIVNTGDMLQHLTGGRYKSGLHRVVCRPNTERMSTPFFGHRKPEASVVPLTHLGESNLTRYHFQTEGEFLTHRLEQIFGKK